MLQPKKIIPFSSCTSQESDQRTARHRREGKDLHAVASGWAAFAFVSVMGGSVQRVDDGLRFVLGPPFTAALVITTAARDLALLLQDPEPRRTETQGGPQFATVNATR
jgi:hypothetical protein